MLIISNIVFFIRLLILACTMSIPLIDTGDEHEEEARVDTVDSTISAAFTHVSSTTASESAVETQGA